jgi:hypothetical protein
MVGDQRVQRRDPLHPFREAAPHQPPPLIVLQFDVVMGLRPVVAEEQHPVLLALELLPVASLEETSGDLMDQCSRHDIPPAITTSSPTGRGTI